MHSDPFLPSQAIHFTGICGVGMTALALCLQDKGVAVSGSDTGEEFVTSTILATRGITIQTGFDPLHKGKKIDGLIYTGSHGGAQNPQVLAAQNIGIPVYSHAKALGLLSHTKKTIAVCGVGGKTTTSAMLATIFQTSHQQPSYAIGVGGVGTLQFPGRWNSEGEYFIVEADEYATSPGTDATPRFMALSPETIICTGIAHDHPDVYVTLPEVQQAFARFFALLPPTGKLIACGDNVALQGVLSEIDQSKLITFGTQAHNDWQIVALATHNRHQRVTIKDPQGFAFELALKVPGQHNALNALAAYIAAQAYGISREESIASINTFSGTKRRFEIIGERDGVTFVDDYAHHPSEIQATLKAAKEWFDDKRLLVVFQPHTYSRTKTLLDGFAQSFAQADCALITDIFASAREAYDPSITAEMLAEAIQKTSSNARYVPQKNLLVTLKETIKPGDVVITMGAGDIYKLHEQFCRD